MSSTPESGASSDETADEVLLAAHDLARAALAEITPETTIGAPAGHTLEPDGVVSLRFETTLPGYPGWFWTVSVARVEDAEPTVLEIELLPSETALLAPDWVPWAVRLADYQAAQVALAEVEAVDADDLDDDLDEDSVDEDLDEDDLDDEDDDLDVLDDDLDEEFDAEGSRTLHAGDLDGVDIDELDDSADDEDSDDEDPDDSDD